MSPASFDYADRCARLAPLSSTASIRPKRSNDDGQLAGAGPHHGAAPEAGHAHRAARVRHFAQLAYAARVAGHEPPGEHDYFFVYG